MKSKGLVNAKVHVVSGIRRPRTKRRDVREVCMMSSEEGRVRKSNQENRGVNRKVFGRGN